MIRIFSRWFIFLFLIGSFNLFGVEGVVGILVRGPEKTIGFPLIYPNAIETWSGNYRYLESDVLVSFTREAILVPSEWDTLTCGKIKGFSPDKVSFFYEEKNWTLFFQFSVEDYGVEPTRDLSPSPGSTSVGAPFGGALTVDQCVFIDKFIIRLKYFLRDAPPLDPPLFPAILEFP